MQHLLGKLAWTACSSGQLNISTDAIEDFYSLQDADLSGILMIDGSDLRFEDEGTMVGFAADYVLKNELTTLTASAKACFERLYEISDKEIGRQHTVSGRILSNLHNSGKIDAFSWAEEASVQGFNIFYLFHVLELSLPYFDRGEANAIFRLNRRSYEQEERDVFGSMLSSKFFCWLTAFPDLARELMKLHDECPHISGQRLYQIALQAYIHHDFDTGVAFAFARTDSSERSISAPTLAALGTLDYSIPEHGSALERVLAICSKATMEPNHPLSYDAVNVARHLLQFREFEVIQMFEKAAQMNHPAVHHGLSEFAAADYNEYRNRSWFWPLIMHLANTDIAQKQTLKNMDRLLYRSLKEPDDAPMSIDFLNAWIGNQNVAILKKGELTKTFELAIHTIGHSVGVLKTIITQWLLNDDLRYPLVAEQVISAITMEEVGQLGLDKSILDNLTKNELLFLVRRILGYISGIDTLLPLCYSMLHTQDAKNRTFALFSDIMHNRIGYDYPEQTLSFLKAKKRLKTTNQGIKRLCTRIIKDLESLRDVVNTLSDLPEFHPSPEKRNRFAKARNRQIAKSVETAEAKSILYRMAVRIPLKAGLRTFQNVPGRNANVNELKEFLHSIAIPRSDIADPLGAYRERLMFRHAKKDDP